MSEFTPGAQVRCVECMKYTEEGKCSSKFRQPTTAPRKRRACTKYSFSGVVHNRTPLPFEERPFWWFFTKKERAILGRMLALGIKDKAMAVPQSSATVNPPESSVGEPNGTENSSGG